MTFAYRRVSPCACTAAPAYASRRTSSGRSMSTTASTLVLALCHRGAVRTQNEDTVAIGPWLGCAEFSRPTMLRFPAAVRLPCLVADGMGGHPHGDVASRLVAAHIATTLWESTGPLPEAAERS